MPTSTDPARLRIRVGAHEAPVPTADVTSLVGYFITLSQQLHAEEHELRAVLTRVEQTGEITAEDFIRLAQAVRGALLFQAHASLMMATWAEKVLADSAGLKE